jgi:hypothetical protein
MYNFSEHEADATSLTKMLQERYLSPSSSAAWWRGERNTQHGPEGILPEVRGLLPQHHSSSSAVARGEGAEGSGGQAPHRLNIIIKLYLLI